MRFNSEDKGQTLIEVVVATALLVMALTVMVAAVVKASANNRLSKERAIATRLAQEGQDYLRGYRDKEGWSSFEGMVLSIGTNEACLPSPLDFVNFPNPTSGNPCSSADALVTQSKTNYIRSAKFTANGFDIYVVEVTVSWYFGQIKQSVKVTNQIANIH